MQRWTLPGPLGAASRSGSTHLKALFLAVGALIALPAAAQPPSIDTCPNCTLGLYDELQLLHNFGDITTLVPKDIYLGVKFAAPETNLAAIEFSISGLAPGGSLLLINFENITTPFANVILGSPPAPADTSATSTQQGGVIVAWPDCIVGSQALFKLTLLAFAQVSNHVLRVMHRFPPSNVLFGLHNPIIYRCDPPNFTSVRVTGLDYVLGGVVAVAPETWSGLKQLYR